MTSAAMTGNAIREALEPFAKLAERHAAFGDDRAIRVDSGTFVTVGDLRRARVAYDAIGSGVKALPWAKRPNGRDWFAATEVGQYAVGEVRDEYKAFLRRITDDGQDQDIVVGKASTESEAKAAAQADFERRVLSCLSPVAVEEADAKAVGPWHGMASAPRDGTYILASGLDFGTGPRRHFTVCLCLEGTDTFVEAEGGEELTYLDAWVPLPGAALLSPHTAAGAGPVGETVVWQFEELHVGFGGQKSWHWRYSETHPGQRPDIRNVQPLYARPVKEPGEVERDEAPQTDGGFLTKGERAAIDKLGEATALRRELAEARGLIRDAIGLVPLAHQNWHTDARTALGDAQEVGR